MVVLKRQSDSVTFDGIERHIPTVGAARDSIKARKEGRGCCLPIRSRRDARQLKHARGWTHQQINKEDFQRARKIIDEDSE